MPTLHDKPQLAKGINEMDQGGAVVIGALIALAGVGLNAGFSELRARTDDRRRQSEKRTRTRGMARMIAGELATASVFLKHAPVPETGPDRVRFSTRSWDLYGPDVCAELPIAVADRLLVAYASIDIFIKGLVEGDEESALPEKEVAALQAIPKGRIALEQYRAVIEREREGLQVALDQARDALLPHVRDEGPTSVLPKTV